MGSCVLWWGREIAEHANMENIGLRVSDAVAGKKGQICVNQNYRRHSERHSERHEAGNKLSHHLFCLAFCFSSRLAFFAAFFRAFSSSSSCSAHEYNMLCPCEHDLRKLISIKWWIWSITCMGRCMKCTHKIAKRSFAGLRHNRW